VAVKAEVDAVEQAFAAALGVGEPASGAALMDLAVSAARRLASAWS
jgi:hypothetical protein